MRKPIAWLGTATLVILCIAKAHAGVGTQLKPYVTLILDTSGSMQSTAAGNGNPTGFGPPDCGAHCSTTLSKLCNTAADCPASESCVVQTDNKLNHAKCAINNIANSYGDIVFAFARFRNAVSGTTTPDTFPAGCCQHGPDAGACNGTSYTCSAADSMFELLTPLVDGSNSAAATWVNFTGNTCTSVGTDPEIWNADSNTPLGGSLSGSQRYYQGLQATDGTTILAPGSAGFDPILNDQTNSVFLGPANCDPSATCTVNCCTSQCRPYVVILLTDGVETCTGNAPNVAAQMLATELHAIAINTAAGSIARAGNVVTVTTLTAHPFVVGDSVVINGVTDVSFNGTFTITTVANNTHFTYAQTAGNASSFGGYAAKNDPINISAIARAGNVVTVTTATTHALQATQSVVIAGVTNASFNGTFTVIAPIDATHFSYAQTAADAASSGGTASHAAMLYKYRVETKAIGFGVAPPPVANCGTTGQAGCQIEDIAHAGGAANVPNVNEGYYANDQVSLELAISQIIAKSVRSETCNNLDDDCDTKIDEDFTTKGQACNNGERGVCLVNGTLVCRTDGTGVTCDAGTAVCNGQPDGTACSVTNSLGNAIAGKCNAGACDPVLVQGTMPELCNGLDDDCDGLIDEGAGCCVPTQEICDGLDNDCDGVPDQTCRCSNNVNQPCNPATPGACGAGSCVCTPITRSCGSGTCLGIEHCDYFGSGTHYSGCDATQACTGPGSGPDCGICDGADNDCDGVCDGFTVGCAAPIAIAAITRVGGVVTVTTAETHPLVMSQSVVVSGVGAAGFDGTFTVTSVPDNTHLTYAQAGANAASSGGTIGSPGGPPTDNPGDPSHSPIPENVCHPGAKTCPVSCAGTNSFGQCLGEVAPSPEICDGLDNDCDNVIDEDFVPTTCNSNCGVGHTKCMNGMVVCDAVQGTVDNTCDNIDDDCDGKIDEDWVCDATPGCVGPNCCSCGTGTTCEQTKCINGVPTCVTNPPINVETCNCADDDCDTRVDEGALCGAGADCVQCQCAYHCNPGEFPCPLGKKCSTDNYCVNDPCFNVTCPDVGGSKQVCHDNGDNTEMCVDVCSPANGIMCPPIAGIPYVCFPPTGECLPDDCRTFPDRCASDQNCVVDPGTGLANCVGNPCVGVTCPTDQYCALGQCYKSCADVDCPVGQRCRMGMCETDPCPKECAYPKVCHDETGQCVENPCQGRDCPVGQWCNFNDGQCEIDPCVGTMCPDPTQIRMGCTCYDPAMFMSDAGVETHVTVGGGGCAVAGGGDGAVIVLALGMLLRRRRRS
jgi:hypothetical protein